MTDKQHDPLFIVYLDGMAEPVRVEPEHWLAFAAILSGLAGQLIDMHRKLQDQTPPPGDHTA